MDLALIAIIAAAFVLLLQIISLAQIAGIRRTIRSLNNSRPIPAQLGDRFEKRNQDFRRHERRPFPDQRPHQQAGPALAPIDPVEKSLRDINLRLKSAERDQESARRRMQEGGFSRGDHNRNRDDRGRGGNRDRDRNRPPRRDGWQDRNRGGGYQQQQASVPSVPSGASAPSVPSAPQSGFPQQRNEPFVQKKDTDLSVPAVDQTTPIQQTGPTTGQDLEASDFSADNLQHGRKIIVKPRILKEDLPAENSGESTSIEEVPGHAPEVSVDQTAPVPSIPPAAPAENSGEETRMTGGSDSDLNPDAKIQFGRGRR